MLAYVKKIHRHSDELLHLALILSLIRVDPESYLGLGLGRSNSIQGSFHNITLGDTWAHAPSDIRHGFMSNMPDTPYLHPKSMEASLTQYQEELIEDLNDLGRYTSILPARNPRTITAYLLDDSSLNCDLNLPNVNTVSPVVATSSSSMIATTVSSQSQHDELRDSVQQQSPQESSIQDDASVLSLEVMLLIIKIEIH
jgi:nuclear factor erythroid 2